MAHGGGGPLAPQGVQELGQPSHQNRLELVEEVCFENKKRNKKTGTLKVDVEGVVTQRHEVDQVAEQVVEPVHRLLDGAAEPGQAAHGAADRLLRQLPAESQRRRTQILFVSFFVFVFVFSKEKHFNGGAMAMAKRRNGRDTLASS